VVKGIARLERDPLRVERPQPRQSPQQHAGQLGQTPVLFHARGVGVGKVVYRRDHGADPATEIEESGSRVQQAPVSQLPCEGGGKPCSTRVEHEVAALLVPQRGEPSAGLGDAVSVVVSEQRRELLVGWGLGTRWVAAPRGAGQFPVAAGVRNARRQLVGDGLLGAGAAFVSGILGGNRRRDVHDCDKFARQGGKQQAFDPFTEELSGGLG